MKKMSKADEDRILDALDDVASLVNNGEDPNSAITKVASDRQMPPGHVGLMVHAYNTGRTNLQRKSHESIMDKAAEFPLADKGKILANMYKDKKEKVASADISDEYSQAPTWLNQNREFEKTAECDLKLCDKPPAYPEDTMAKAAKAYDTTVFYGRKLEDMRRQVNSLHDQNTNELAKLANYFQTIGNISIKETKDNLQVLLDDKANKVFELVESRLPKNWHKYAASNRPQKMVAIDSYPYSAIIKLANDLKTYDHLSEKLAQANDAVTQLGRKLISPFCPSEHQNTEPDLL